jgi:hypothetical protein
MNFIQHGLIALDIYISGKRVNARGPFLQYIANDVKSNEEEFLRPGQHCWMGKPLSAEQFDGFK